MGRVFALVGQRSAVKSAGSDLYLPDRAVFFETDLLSAALAGIPGIVCLSVIEDIPVISDLYDAAVVIVIIIPGNRFPEQALPSYFFKETVASASSGAASPSGSAGLRIASSV